MLTESQVIHHVCTFLEQEGFVVDQRLKETERGYDIIASRPNSSLKLAIEAKGETSSKVHTKRFGLPFSSNQIYVHVAQAFYCAATYGPKGYLGGLALPNTKVHVKHVEAIRSALKVLGIEVFLVSSNGEIEVWRHWNIWKSIPAYEPQA